MLINPLAAELAARFTKDSRIAILTGAGVSAESGVATFRDKDNGLWSKFNPQQLANFTSFLKDPELVWQWYDFRKQTISQVQPNAGHRALAEMEELFPSFTLITQNIDNLHQRAGSQQVIELHGNIERNYCIRCKKPKAEISNLPPTCDYCGELVRPDVVWFGEMLPVQALQTAFEKAKDATIFLVIGTSAEVYPAAQLPYEAINNGAFTIVINPDETPVSRYADCHIFAKSGEYLPDLLTEIRKTLH